MKTLELQTTQPLAVERREPSALDMIQKVIEGGITPENVAALRELVALKKDMDRDKAERDFAAAFVKLQSQLPAIVATSVIPNRGKYEKFEDIMAQIAKPLHANGFCVSFDQESTADGRIKVTCQLTHAGGVTRSNSITVRSGGRADSELQADCKTTTTARRNALCHALNIVIRQDVLDSEDDARNLGTGAFVTETQANELHRRATDCGADMARLLKFAGAKIFAEIPAAKFDEIDGILRTKEGVK